MNNRSEMKPIEKNITLQADIDKVWQAVSTSEGIAS